MTVFICKVTGKNSRREKAVERERENKKEGEKSER
jgi:hypothetical protein